jgi:cytochrome c oxidase subunit II
MRGFTASMLLLSTAALAGCNGSRPQSVLAPEGPGAAGIERLWWILLTVTGVATAITFVLIAWALLRRSRPAVLEPASLKRELWVIVVAGAAIPSVLLLVLLVFTFRIGGQVAEPPGPAAVTVEVIGHQFWWEVRYPDHEVMTANEIHIPVGQPVRLRLRSADVIHSFWVPKLHGKMDMTPGHVSSFWLQADRPGVYRGQCAEFCGIQHALMAFLVVAEPPEAFAAWLDRHRRPAAEPEDPLRRRGLEVYFAAGCAACHSVRGTTPPVHTGTVGPDLTHLASRRTLAAAIIANNRGNLAGWILDPQAIKPGNRMPRSTLSPEDLHALVAYLEGLE